MKSCKVKTDNTGSLNPFPKARDMVGHINTTEFYIEDPMNLRTLTNHHECDITMHVDLFDLEYHKAAMKCGDPLIVPIQVWHGDTKICDSAIRSRNDYESFDEAFDADERPPSTFDTHADISIYEEYILHSNLWSMIEDAIFLITSQPSEQSYTVDIKITGSSWHMASSMWTHTDMILRHDFSTAKSFPIKKKVAGAISYEMTFIVKVTPGMLAAIVSQHCGYTVKKSA